MASAITTLMVMSVNVSRAGLEHTVMEVSETHRAGREHTVMEVSECQPGWTGTHCDVGRYNTHLLQLNIIHS